MKQKQSGTGVARSGGGGRRGQLRPSSASLVPPTLAKPRQPRGKSHPSLQAAIGQTGWRMVQFGAIRSRLAAINNREKQGINREFGPF